MIVPLILGGAAFYLGGRYKFAKRNRPRPRRNGVSVSSVARTSATVPGHLFFQDAYMRTSAATCSFSGTNQTCCVDPSGLTVCG